MMRHTVAAGAVLAGLLAWTASPANAQAPASGGALSSLSVVAGAGGVFAGSQAGADHSTGAAFIGALEFRQPWRPSFFRRVALRVEGGYSSQGLSLPDRFVTGNVHSLHGAALVSVAVAERGRFESYVLGGPVLSRLSTRMIFDAPTNQTPGAGFQQTTHETAPGVALGVGAGWRVRSVSLRLEARWMSLATNAKATTSVPVMLSVAIPLHR